MFSINIYLRFALIAGLIILGGVLQYFYGFWYAFIFYLAGLVLLVGYFLTGTIQSATMLLQTQDFDAAKKRLDLTLFPKLLFGPAKSAYYMLKGSLAMQGKDYDEAQKFFKISEHAKYTSDNERAMVYLQQANVAAMKNNIKEAQQIFRKTDGLKVTEQVIKDQMKQFDQALKQRASVTMNHRMMAAQRGGTKQRRPKMR